MGDGLYTYIMYSIDTVYVHRVRRYIYVYVSPYIICMAPIQVRAGTTVSSAGGVGEMQGTGNEFLVDNIYPKTLSEISQQHFSSVFTYLFLRPQWQ